MTKLLNRNEAASYIETLDAVRNAPEEASAKWATKEGERRYAKRFDYVELDDGAVIRFDKPRIMSEFWYDDETDGPWSSEEGKREHFMSANLRNVYDGGLSRWEKEQAEFERIGCCSGDHVTRPWVELPSPGSADGTLVFRAYGRERVEDDPQRRRYLTDAEIEGLRAVNRKRRESFSKRLASYWKNHSDKVYARGYWRDR